MSSSLAFNCPSCGKPYDRVKASMTGRKVKCSCGKIFRLGPKTEAQKAADAARRAKKRAAQLEANNHASLDKARPANAPLIAQTRSDADVTRRIEGADSCCETG